MERTITGATHSTVKTNGGAFEQTVAQHEEAAILPKTSLFLMIYANFTRLRLNIRPLTPFNKIRRETLIQMDCRCSADGKRDNSI
jgi:hypothetical protein